MVCWFRKKYLDSRASKKNSMEKIYFKMRIHFNIDFDRVDDYVWSRRIQSILNYWILSSLSRFYRILLFDSDLETKMRKNLIIIRYERSSPSNRFDSDEKVNKKIESKERERERHLKWFKRSNEDDQSCSNMQSHHYRKEW